MKEKDAPLSPLRQVKIIHLPTGVSEALKKIIILPDAQAETVTDFFLERSFGLRDETNSIGRKGVKNFGRKTCFPKPRPTSRWSNRRRIRET